MTRQGAGKLWLLLALFLAFALTLPLQAQTPGGYVYVDNQTTTNSISVYKVFPTGTVTTVGTPVSTGAAGSSALCYGLNRMVVDPVNNLLFVANTGNRSITPFQINPATGALTRTAGSPFPSGLTADSCQGMSLAVTPDGQFLMAASNAEIRTFTIGAGGALTFLSSTANCCTPNASMVISPDGRFLAVSNQTSISMYTISAGVLTPVVGSPFPKLGTGSLARLAFSCAANRLYAGEAIGTGTLSEGWTVDATGVLAPTNASPYTDLGTNSNDVFLSADNSLLFQSNQLSNSINAFTVNTDGSIAKSGHFSGTTFAHIPAGMATDAAGNFLYAADDGFGLDVYRIGNGGLLALLKRLSITGPKQIQDVVSYPPPACGTADLQLQASAVPNPAIAGAPIQYTVTVQNNGPDAASAVVSDALPPTVSAGGSAQIVNPSGAQRTNTVNGTNVDGAVTITTTVPHDLFVGESVTVGAVPDPTIPNPIQSGFFLTDPGFNGVFPVTSIISPTSFTYNQTIPVTSFPRPTLTIVANTGAQRLNGVVTITATQVFQLAPGTLVDVSGVTDPSFNGTDLVVQSQPTATTFTYLQPGAALSTAVRTANVVTVTTATPLTLSVGQKVTIQGVADTSFDGTFTITSILSPTSFTFAQTAADASSSGGTVNLADTISGGGTVTGPRVISPTDQAGGGSASSPTCIITIGLGSCGSATFAPRPLIASAVRTGNLVTITTSTPHQLFAGNLITVQGVANTSFNGSFTIASVPSPTSLTYNQTAADATSSGGIVNGPNILTQLLTFNDLASGEARTAIINATSSGTLANGTVINNTVSISNSSKVDPDLTLNSVTVPVAIGTTVATSITVPTATGPYGGVATVTAILTDASGNPVAGKTIGFNFNQDNSFYTGVTDGTGTATAIVPLGFTTVGTHTAAFTATFGGDALYGPSSATGDLIVTKAVLTVTADNQSRLYGDPNPPLTYTITGFVNGDTIAVVSGTADCTTTATITSPVGTYPITCTIGTLAAVNYDFIFVDGTLTVNPAPLTVTVDSFTRAYGDPNPVFTGTITGIKNNDPITATYSTTATITSFVGTYPITATLSDGGTGALANYAVTIIDGTLTINPVPLVVTANNAGRLYGDPNPPFSGTITGIKNNDPITATYTSPATETSPVGSYPIIPTLSDNGSGALVNYTVTAINGILLIAPAPLTVQAADATMPYGGPIPTFTGTITGIKNLDPITATYSTTATVTSPPGLYPIVPTVSDGGTGLLSNYTVTLLNGTLTVTQAILTVTVNNATMIYGDPLPVFTGTIAGIVNGDPITATYSTTATSASPIGTYPITATLSDGGTGLLANYQVIINNGVLTITSAPLTVTVDSFTRLYGDPNPVLTGTIVGIKNGDPITAIYSTTANPTSPVGVYPIVATLSDGGTGVLANYTVAITNGTLTVTPAPLTVTANNASKLFNTPNPPLSGIITGIKNGDPITATYSTTAITTSPVGTYPITPALSDPAGKLGNYTVTSNNGVLTINAAPTANFLFVNNQAATGNSINGYSVAVDGTLTALAGSPVATGGLGANAACSSVDRMALSAGNNLLFVSNGGDQSISAFSIDATSGALTAAVGSPFASGLTLDACGGISLAATPDGQYLMASSNGQIKTFSIGAGGVLTALSTATNSVVPNASMKISANGQFLAVSNGTSVSMYTINGDGSLTAVAGSPFAETGTATLAGLDFSSTSGLLYGAEASATGAFADAWTVGANGALSAVLGSPFSTTETNSNAVLLSPNDAFLFASNQGSATVSSYTVGAGGVLSGVASSGTLHAPVGMATDRSGTLLFVADDAFGVGVFNVGGAGSLTQLNDTAITGAGQVQSLVAYPPRMTSTADLSAAISSSSPTVVAGLNVTFTITVTNNGPDPASATVTDALPTGFSVVSCAATGNGVCIGNTGAANFFLLQSGESQTVTLVTTTSLSIPDGTIATNTASISNSSAIDPNAANNSASVSVTVSQPITTVLTVAAASGTYGGSTSLSATLTNLASTPIAGKTVDFSLNGTLVGSATTDTFGLATIPASLIGINAGVYTGGVTASFAGDPNNKASNGSADLTVNPAVLTVTATNATRVYGDPNPAFTFTFAGFVNGETSAVLTGTPSCTTVADPTSAVGSYPIVCTQGTLAAANYTFVFVNGTLSITPAPLTVTPANASRLYGDPNPTFTGTITGIKNGDNITAVYTTTATQASPVGTYPITAALVDPTNKLGNYTVTSNTGTLTITPAPLTVTAANATMPFGGPLPALTGTITGIKNADPITATYSTTATATSPVGTYPIVPALSDGGTGLLANYAVTVNNGTLTITNAVLTVNVANASMIYGDPLPVLTGTITGIQNGDTITATYSTTATSASPVGTYPITATLSDGGTGALANYTVVINNGTLTINQAPLTVTVANASRLYGAANPAFTGTITGLKNGDVITATYSTTAIVTSPVGTYPITPTLSDPAGKLPNYAVTTTNGVLTVTPAPLTVTAANATRLYGDPDPVFTGTITGLLNGDNITAVYTTTATTASPVGTYPIVPTLVDPTNKLGNYAVTSNNGTLTITPAPLTVTAANATMPFGGPVPTLTGTITGIKNGDPITATYSTTATTTSPVGTYPIVPALSDGGTGRLANYAVTINNGTLTISNAVLTVTAANASRLYGDPNPVFTGTITGILNGDNITATYASTATATSPVGTYAIVPTLSDNGTGALANYTIVVNNGVLTVNQAPLAVTAANATRLYGDLNPALTGTITGIKNGDNITAVYTTTATQTSPVGTYPITVGLVDPTNKLSNYAVTVTNGVLTVSPAPLTVTAANATMPFGGPVPTLTGTITGIKNGDPITATYSTTATTTSPVGTYPIVPALSDGGTGLLANYAVTVNNGTLTITNAVLTVTAANASMIYGDPLPVLTGTITGILNGDPITATYTTVATSASPVGTYAIVPVLSDGGTGALANYTIVINNGVLTINPAPLSVAAANASMIYGDPVPALTGSIVGIKNGDAITATFSTTATSASPVGAYPIVPTLVDPTGKLTNYTVTSTNGTLTINPAPLTVTADNASRLFGTPNPPFTGTITGIKNGDPITATYSTTATAASPAGTYPITPALVDPAGKLGNYTVTSNNGTLTVNAAPTANFLFVNNQGATANNIDAFSVAADGTLAELAGSPVATGGLGANAACSSVDRMALSAGNNLLFVSNGGDQTISAFSIDPTSGALTAAGAPAASGLTLDACGGISLAATPDGRFLMASSNGQVKTFSIGVGGALTALSTATNSVVPNSSMKISANGQFLAVSNGTSVSMYTINADGSLTAVAGSPFAETGTATLAGLDFSSSSGLLFGAEASATASLADAWTVGANGGLTAVVGSPFSIGAVNSNAVRLSPNDAFLFASNQGGANVTSFSQSAGALTSLGSFGALHAPVGMATDRSGSLLFVADDTFGVGVFSINSAGSLAQLSDTAITGAGQVQSLVAYPPRMASSADVSVSVAASAASIVAGQNVTYTISVTNNGPDAASATIANSLPAGFTQTSCTATGNGACIGATGAANFFLLQSGETQTVTLVASSSTTIANGTIATDSVSITNASASDPNAANNSASVDVTVGQPAATTLTVAAASGTYGGSTTVSATLSNGTGPLSGQTVSFSLNGTAVGSAVTDATGLATLSASLGTIGAGTFPAGVTASFAGNLNNQASTGSASLTVNPAPLNVSAANATRVYGDPNPVFSGTITGIVNGDNITATYSSTAVATSGVGTYPITPTLSDNATGALANYTVTSSNGTLTVTPALLTVTAANASMLFGDPVPALTGTITGIKNADNITATYSTTATSTSPVGTYPIVPSVSDNGTGALVNYTVSLVNGTLTINPAPLTVTAASTSMIYGDPVPALSGTITGIKNGDAITATYSTTATSTSPVGTYPITPSVVATPAVLANYTVTLVNGTLTINPAPLTVTAANASMIYGDPVPAFSGTITGIKNADNITATYSTTATSASPVGTYPITPTLSDNATGALANYTVTSNNGTLTINPAPLSVTAANATMVYGDPLPAFSGTITGIRNADNITATYSTTATSASPVGTYPITPTLSDNATGALANYTVTSTNGTLTITPAPLTVTAANATMVFGDPVPTLTGTVTGIKNGDNITGVYTTTATSTSPVGTYPITAAASDNATGALANYTVTLVNATLTITPAPLTVTAANATMVFGDPVPTLTGTITGIKNGDLITATYATTATSTSPVGTYPITPTVVATPAVLANYTVTLVNGTLTITPAPLTATATSTSMIFGDPVPAVTGTLTGVKNGDNITASFTTTATSTTGVGGVPIVAAVSDNATGALANYTVTLVNGTLTINPAPLTVTAANASMVYGDPVPAVTGTLTGVKNGDNITASFSTTATSATGVGGVPIVGAVSDNATGALANYTVTINNGTLTISPAPLSVTINSATRVYGDPNPTFTGTITGIKNADNITFGATSVGPTAAVGTYPITPALVDPTGKLVNYTVTSTNGTLTVTPAPLSVTAADATMVFGSPVPALTGTITGIKNADNITATYSTTATSASPVGTYPITPTLSDNATGALANYTVTSTNGTLTITPAPLTIQAADATAPVGGPFPAFTGTITGAVNGDVLTATYSTTATLTSPAGTYPIIPAPDPLPAFSNYSVTLINGTLTLTTAVAVGPATLISTSTTTDVQVTGSANKGSVTVPAPDTLTWQIKDNQSTQANNVVFTSDLPAGIQFNAVSTTLGSCSGPAVGTSGTITCVIPTLSGGATATVTVDVTVAAVGTFNTTGSVSFDGTDTNTGNNSATVKINGQ